MRMYPCNQVFLNGYLDEKLDLIRDNDPHATALRRMVESFRGDDETPPDRDESISVPYV